MLSAAVLAQTRIARMEAETPIFCLLCTRWLNGIEQYTEHLQYKMHKRNVRQQIKESRSEQMRLDSTLAEARAAFPALPGTLIGDAILIGDLLR